MKLIIETEGPAAELTSQIAAARREGQLISRIELTRAEYDALVADIEWVFRVDFRQHGPLGNVEGVALYVDGRPAQELGAGIVVPRPPPGPRP